MNSRVTELRYVGYAVPDFEAERAFYKGIWGLNEVACDSGIAYFAAEGSPEPFIVRIRETPHQGLDVLGLAAATAFDVDQLHQQLNDADVKIITSPRKLDRPGGGYGFRFFDPDGHVLEISAEVEPGPSRELRSGESIPKEISHIGIHSPNKQNAEAFYVEKLGFKPSDWVGDFLSFLRCSSKHHRVVLVPGPPAVNHLAFEMKNADEMMRGLARLRKEGLKLEWGPGRHTAGNNTFSYFQTPNGNIVEYTAEVELVDDATWQPTRYEPRREVMDQWGIAEGGPEQMRPPVPDPGIWQPVFV